MDKQRVLGDEMANTRVLRALTKVSLTSNGIGVSKDIKLWEGELESLHPYRESPLPFLLLPRLEEAYVGISYADPLQHETSYLSPGCNNELAKATNHLRRLTLSQDLCIKRVNLLTMYVCLVLKLLTGLQYLDLRVVGLDYGGFGIGFEPLLNALQLSQGELQALRGSPLVKAQLP